MTLEFLYELNHLSKSALFQQKKIRKFKFMIFESTGIKLYILIFICFCKS